MKKILSLILVLTTLLSLCIGFVSCGEIADIALDVLDEVLSEDSGEGDVTVTPDEDDPKLPEIIESEDDPEQPDIIDLAVDKDGEYDDCDHVALYIHLYGKLPKNFMPKSEAEKEGWVAGPLYKVIPGKALGGTFFGNYDKKLPKKKGRTYYECDIDTIGAKERGAKRIIYSDDGLVYYTDDHYETFTLLYGEE